MSRLTSQRGFRFGLLVAALLVAGCQAGVAPTPQSTAGTVPIEVTGRGIGQSATFALDGDYYVVAAQSGPNCDPYPLAVTIAHPDGTPASAVMTGGRTHMHNLHGQFYALVSAGCDWTIDFTRE